MAGLVRSIPMSGIAHPLVDQVGESGGRGWSLTESRARVVTLDGWRLDLLRRCTEKGREVVLATDETSALTPALVQVWREAGAHWMVRDPDGGLRDGFTGRPLHAVGDLWAPGGAPSSADVAVGHLRPARSDALELTAVVSVRMSPRGSSRLGGGVTELFGCVGDEPLAWGTREPALRGWDVEALTSAVRRRMPEVRLVVRGRHTAAVVQVRRTRRGLEETTYASLSTTGGPDAAAEAFARATATLSRIAGTAMPLVGLVLAQPGRRDLLRTPFLRPPAVPVALLVGPPVAKSLGIDPDGEQRRTGAASVGRPKIPGLLYRFSTAADDPATAWHKLEQVLAGFNHTTRTTALGAAGPVIGRARPDCWPSPPR